MSPETLRTPFALLAMSLLLAACATATPYQPQAKSGEGYSEQRLETNRYRIRSVGNSATSRETVENYLMYRAAEITLQNGYDWFAIADRATNVDPQLSGGGSNFGIGIGGSSGNFGSGVSIGLSSLFGGGNKSAYQAQADILVYKNPRTPNLANSFDARELKANLESTIQRPAPKR
ncbi:CC0125/CC1285 family lipoprotein [Hydrocarboniphaga effusa]|uniref:CC0125/CC1285 family lipoprotein n=1 Tax=Hydrocarboniphaga effusa TaxID=243629 RepID=UPI00398C1DD6